MEASSCFPSCLSARPDCSLLPAARLFSFLGSSAVLDPPPCPFRLQVLRDHPHPGGLSPRGLESARYASMGVMPPKMSAHGEGTQGTTPHCGIR